MFQDWKGEPEDSLALADNREVDIGCMDPILEFQEGLLEHRLMTGCIP